MGPLPAAAAAPAQRHRMPPQRGAQRAARRTVAALAALVAFLAVLAVVPLATAEPAEAHDLYYWKTVRTCIVDPPINHCTTKRVRLPAHHSHPPPPTTPPNPPTEEDLWGTTTTTAAPPPTTQPKQCPAGSHRYGNGCHSHGFTPPSCGTGTWTPHAGHSITFLQPCPTTPPRKCADGYSGTPPSCVKDKPKVCPDGQTGTPPNCTEPNKNGKGSGGSGGTTTTDDSPRKCDGSEWHQNFWHQHGSSGCHQTGTKHCPDGQHEHVHGSQQCHTLGKSTKNASGTHSGWTDHCASGEHSHEHSGSCHTATSESAECAKNYTYSYSTQKCELDTGLKIFQRGTRLYVAGTGEVLCTFTGGRLAKNAANKILKEVNDFSKWLFGAGVELTIESPCDQAWGWYEKHMENTLEFKPETVDPDDSGGSQQPTPDQDDPDGDYDGDGKTTAEEAHEAALRYEAGELTDAEYYRIIYKSWCDRGDSYYCGK